MLRKIRQPWLMLLFTTIAGPSGGEQCTPTINKFLFTPTSVFNTFEILLKHENRTPAPKHVIRDRTIFAFDTAGIRLSVLNQLHVARFKHYENEK